MNFKFRRIIPALLSLVMLFAVLQLPSFAAGTKYEVEPNNTTSKADTTYDDYDNYGTISSAADIDFWRFTPSETCFANIWLGNIPSGCSYTLSLLDSSYNAVAMTKDHQYGSQKLMKCRLVGGKTYYVSIHSDSGYSADTYYRFRIKTYDLGVGRIFTSTDSDYDTSATGAIKSTLWSMGYDADNYLNNSASAVFSTIASSRIVMIHNPAGAGYMTMPASIGHTYLCANNHANIQSYSRGLSALAAGAMSNTALAIYLGDYTANTHGAYGNLVEMTLSKGASCAIGWYNELDRTFSTGWANAFFDKLNQNRSITAAIGAADTWASNTRPNDFLNMVDIYVGTSDTGAIAP